MEWNGAECLTGEIPCNADEWGSEVVAVMYRKQS